MPGAWSLLKQVASVLRKDWRPFSWIIFISLALSLVFVQGLGTAFDIVKIKTDLEELLGAESSAIGVSLTLFSYMLGSTGTSSSQAGGAYQLLLTLIISLATIWLVRQLLAGYKSSARDAFYKGMYPMVPFILVLVVIGLQLLPLLLGNLLLSTVISNGLAVTIAEYIIFILLFGLLALLSFYMITSSLFAVYIVTLPDMTPLKALRSARELVLHRRLGVWLRIIALPLALLAISAILVIPMLLVSAPVAQLIFLLIGSASLVIFHTYMYLLYRALL